MGKHCIKCIACGIKKEYNPDTRFFKLPANTERREKWLLNIGRIDLNNVKISEDYRICEQHFDEKMRSKCYNRLMKSALPKIISSFSNPVILKEEILISTDESNQDTKEFVPIIELNKLPEIASSNAEDTKEYVPIIELNKLSEIASSNAEEATKYTDTIKLEHIKVEEETVWEGPSTSYWLPTTSKGTQTEMESVNLEKKLEEVQEERDRLKAELETAKEYLQSVACFVEKARSILPPELAKEFENHMKKFSRNS